MSLEMVESLDDGYRNYSKFTKTVAAILVVTTFSRYYGITVMSESFADFTTVGTVAMAPAIDHTNNLVIHSDTNNEHVISLMINGIEGCVNPSLNKFEHPEIHMNDKLIKVTGMCVGDGNMILTPTNNKMVYDEMVEKSSVTFSSPTNYLGTYRTTGFKMAWGKTLSEVKFRNNSIPTRTLTSTWVK